MNIAEWMVSAALLLPLFYGGILLTIALFRHVLWWLHYPIRLIDEFMWFLYNPVRAFMHNRRSGLNRPINRLVTYTLIKPLWQIAVWFFTTPLRFVTGIYFDVIMYLAVMAGDTIQDLIQPKDPFMRKKKGLAYGFYWLVLFPWRCVKFIMANLLAVIDSLFMLILSVAWPTFTMFHGTNESAAESIQHGGKWLVGSGNFGGSGIYFGRSVKVANSYGKGFKNLSYDDQNRQISPIIVARVTLTMLRNAGVTRRGLRKDFGDRTGHGGKVIAQKIGFPYYAVELWRDDRDWWEYCLLQGGKEGDLVQTWRIRPVGYVKVLSRSDDLGELQRLWGGRSHYCMQSMNILVVVLSAPVAAAALMFSLTAWGAIIGS